MLCGGMFFYFKLKNKRFSKYEPAKLLLLTFVDIEMNFSKKILCFIFALSLAACGGGDSSSDSTHQGNTPPVAAAGSDFTAAEGEPVTISAKSSDSDGTIESYEWKQMSGLDIVITGEDTSSISFTAPEVDAFEVVVLQLEVTDDKGSKSTDQISITISPILDETQVTGGVIIVEEGVAQKLTLDETVTDDSDGSVIIEDEADIPADWQVGKVVIIPAQNKSESVKIIKITKINRVSKGDVTNGVTYVTPNIDEVVSQLDIDISSQQLKVGMVKQVQGDFKASSHIKTANGIVKLSKDSESEYYWFPDALNEDHVIAVNGNIDSITLAYDDVTVLENKSANQSVTLGGKVELVKPSFEAHFRFDESSPDKTVIKTILEYQLKRELKLGAEASLSGSVADMQSLESFKCGASLGKSGFFGGDQIEGAYWPKEVCLGEITIDAGSIKVSSDSSDNKDIIVPLSLNLFITFNAEFEFSASAELTLKKDSQRKVGFEIDIEEDEFKIYNEDYDTGIFKNDGVKVDPVLQTELKGKLAGDALATIGTVVALNVGGTYPAVVRSYGGPTLSAEVEGSIDDAGPSACFDISLGMVSGYSFGVVAPTELDLDWVSSEAGGSFKYVKAHENEISLFSQSSCIPQDYSASFVTNESDGYLELSEAVVTKKEEEQLTNQISWSVYFGEVLIHSGTGENKTIYLDKGTYNIVMTAILADGQEITQIKDVEITSSIFADENLASCVVDNLRAAGLDLPYDIEQLSCRNQEIEDTSGISHLVSMTTLDLQNNNISSIDITSNDKLEYLDISNNQLTELDISSNYKLNTLILSNNSISAIDLSKNPLLQTVYLSSNNITSIDLANNSEIVNLKLTSNQIASIDLSNNTSITDIDLSKNHLKSIDLSSNTQLQEIELADNYISIINVDSNTNLISLGINNNPLTEDTQQYLETLIAKGIEVDSSNISPTADAGESMTVIEGGLVTLSASGSSDSDGTIDSYEWKEGETQLSKMASFSKKDFSAGEHIISLSVTDNNGATNSDEMVLTINVPPDAKAGEDVIAELGEAVTLDASDSNDEGSITRYEWREGVTILSTAVRFSKNDFAAGVHTITLTVMDNDGAIATDEIVITVGNPVVTDGDGDGIADEVDNCPSHANADQLNTDGDAQGNACDADDDNDGILDVDDDNPLVADTDAVTVTIDGIAQIEHGTITPTEPRVVHQGKPLEFTVIADAGYYPYISGCGGSLVGTTFTITAVNGDCAITLSFKPPTAPLNDTGATRCGNETDSDLDCPQAGFSRQDAEFGRDVAHNDDSDGHAGFSFTKICNGGEAAGEGNCPAQPLLGSGANNWGCTRDNVTGLIWEVKTDDGGLRDKDNTFSWYNSNSNTNGGDAGTENGGTCPDNGNCDTEKYVASVNAVGLCGYSDWRMPDFSQLLSIMNRDAEPAIDIVYFPNPTGTRVSEYWTASPYVPRSGNVWSISSTTGGGSTGYTHFFDKSVRLVRQDSN